MRSETECSTIPGTMPETLISSQSSRSLVGHGRPIGIRFHLSFSEIAAHTPLLTINSYLSLGDFHATTMTAKIAHKGEKHSTKIVARKEAVGINPASHNLKKFPHKPGVDPGAKNGIAKHLLGAEIEQIQQPPSSHSIEIPITSPPAVSDGRLLFLYQDETLSCGMCNDKFPNLPNTCQFFYSNVPEADITHPVEIIFSGTSKRKGPLGGPGVDGSQHQPHFISFNWITEG